MKRALVVVLAVACGGREAAKPAATTPAATTTATGAMPATTTVALHGVTSGDAPEISRGIGEAGGFVVLWPRAKAGIDGSAAIAGQLQARLVDIVKRVAPGKPVDVRPEPERVCPRSGCKGVAVGAALMRNGDACAVIATVSASGPSEATLVAWAGDMTLKSPVSAFREPPEAQVQVRDYGLCSSIVGELGAREQDVEAAIKRAAGL